MYTNISDTQHGRFEQLFAEQHYNLSIREFYSKLADKVSDDPNFDSVIALYAFHQIQIELEEIYGVDSEEV